MSDAGIETKSKISVKVLPGATHGSFVFESDYQRATIDIVLETYKLYEEELAQDSDHSSGDDSID